MGIFRRESHDPFYDLVPPGGEYVVDCGEVFVGSDGSTFTGTEAMAYMRVRCLGFQSLKSALAENAAQGAGGSLALAETQAILRQRRQSDAEL